MIFSRQLTYFSYVMPFVITPDVAAYLNGVSDVPLTCSDFPKDSYRYVSVTFPLSSVNDTVLPFRS